MTTEQATSSTLVAIRAAHHAEATPQYDRVVFEFNGALPLLRIEYVDELIADGSGQPVPVAGRHILCVQFSGAHAHDDQGVVTAPGQLKPRMPLVKEIVCSGDFEAIVTYGVGVSRKAEIRVLTLADKSRVVIDFVL
jgi:hypothetical protein